MKYTLTTSIFPKATVAVLAVLLALVLNSTQASAATPPDSCFAFNTGTGTITNYYAHEANNPANPACPKDVDIPATIGGTSVMVIGNNAFYNKQIISVTFPDSVTAIGNQAFMYNQIANVTIPGSISNIGTYAFADNQLVSISIKYGVTSIGTSAFQNNQLTEVTIPASVATIEYMAFRSNLLTDVTIQAGVTSIGGSAFSQNRLTSISIPGSVTSIGNGAFWNNQLTSVNIMDGVNSIDRYAFYGNRLSSVTIPTSVASIGVSAFALQSEWGGDLDRGTNGAPDFWSDDPAEVQVAYDSIWYARLYTVDSSNPNGLMSGMLDENYWWGEDANENGLNDSLGGHLINPSSISIKYIDQGDDSLYASQTFTGFLDDNHTVNYFAYQGPAAPSNVEMLPDYSDVTQDSKVAINQSLSAYYRIGDSVTITPPAIDGYITPPTQTFVLGAADNTFSYVYASTNPGDTPTTLTPEDELAATGVPAPVIGGVIIALLSLSSPYVVKKYKFYRIS